MKAKWWIISGVILVGAGVGAYFLFRKPTDEKKDILTKPNGDASASNKPPSGSSTTPNVSYPPTPFVNNSQGNHFRGFVNTEYPQIAKEIDLDRSVSFANGYNNQYIRKAWALLCKSYIDTAIPPQDPDYTKFKNACK